MPMVSDGFNSHDMANLIKIKHQEMATAAGLSYEDLQAMIR